MSKGTFTMFAIMWLFAAYKIGQSYPLSDLMYPCHLDSRNMEFLIVPTCGICWLRVSMYALVFAWVRNRRRWHQDQVQLQHESPIQQHGGSLPHMTGGGLSADDFEVELNVRKR